MESLVLTLIKLILFFSALHHLPPPPTAISSRTTTFPKQALPTKSGYLPINSTTGSAIFYVFYEAKNPNNSSLSQTPLLIWLQGGPGCSSMTGNFYELGPFLVTSSQRQNVEHLTLKPNPHSWNRLFGLLFLDNPIGTGFSIASTPEEIPRDQNAVAKHLSIAIKKFIASDSTFESRPIYITGESYAGKYVPSIGYYIVKRNANLSVSKRVNLIGLAIGNGLTDPSWVKKMKWGGMKEYLESKREVWVVKGEIAGYVQKWRSLSSVVVLGAGHLVPADQPLNSQAMIEDWVLEKGLPVAKFVEVSGHGGANRAALEPNEK
ncbi:hypothetical protein L6452_21022 [Arctium lappa]|uniref:Uncharacterized protein n=1 Tax=Arctium lappa TaxID=4217 RepID=A0ACB9BC74_ARCLA|nr:hypothetical protein L6452_21022 [Arctium lappa]